MSHGRSKQWRPSSRSGHANLRRAVFIRDKFTCRLCGLKAIWPHKPTAYTGKFAVKFTNGKPLTVDHIVEMDHGGKNKMNNLRALCEKCNTSRMSNEGKKQSQVSLLDRHGFVYEDGLWRVRQ